MLRTLGYKKKKLFSLLSTQTLTFAVPATILGVIIMMLSLSGIKIWIYSEMKFAIETYIDTTTIIVASYCAINNLIGDSFGVSNASTF